MLTLTGLYALQALLHLAGKDTEALTSAAAMAQALDIPRTYLAKILQRLTRDGLLESTRGPRGGYQLTRSPSLVTVAEVVAPFQDLRMPQVCLMGGPCDVENPCPAHERRNAWNTRMLDLMKDTTLADLLTGTPLEEFVPVGNTTSEETP